MLKEDLDASDEQKAFGGCIDYSLSTDIMNQINSDI